MAHNTTLLQWNGDTTTHQMPSCRCTMSQSINPAQGGPFRHNCLFGMQCGSVPKGKVTWKHPWPVKNQSHGAFQGPQECEGKSILTPGCQTRQWGWGTLSSQLYHRPLVTMVFVFKKTQLEAGYPHSLNAVSYSLMVYTTRGDLSLIKGRVSMGHKGVWRVVAW
jgi:hypothetical protein